MTTREQLGDEQYLITAYDGSVKVWNDFCLAANCWKVQVGESERAVVIACVYTTKEDAVKAAADFTEQREREIQEKMEEIDLVRYQFIESCTGDGEGWKRILSLLEAQLKELQKGMKG